MNDKSPSSNSGALLRPKDKKKRMYRDVKYAALTGDDEEDDDSSIQLANRRPQQEENTITRTLQPGDTLQSISLQYYVPVAELKRLNNILRDNEIHARTTLKIPLRPITSLVDLTPESRPPAPPELVTLRIGSGCNPTEFLAAMDRDLAKIRAAVPQVEPAAAELRFNAPERSTATRDGLGCSGSDWGLRWQQILLLSLLFSLSLPLFIWYKRHHADEATESSRPPS